ncbi:MAG: 16S rRNA (uracil(1498)-N(3))-methyltransferase [Planctomycetota bacterium]|nr:MAG: 16S rRNA (uracil(1498)-N(3))-methyltransferase [Planctomycetota bacterium]
MRTLIAPAPLIPGEVFLSDEEAHHGRSVLRLAVGDRCRLCDGEGVEGVAEVILSDKRHFQLRLDAVARPTPPLGHDLEVVLAAPKGGRLEDCLRSLVELGVGRLGIIGFERSSRLPSLERCQRVIREALKQCRSAFLPQLSMYPSLDHWRPHGRVVMLSPTAQPGAPSQPCPTSLVIGPEGGLTDAEEAGLLSAGACGWRLCAPILRIETAAVAAAAVVVHAWECHNV